MTNKGTNENLALVQATYAAFGRQDMPAVLANMSTDCEIGIVGRKEDAPFLGMHRGHAGVGEFFKGLGEAHEIHMLEPLRMVAAEDKVFVWGHYDWTMRKSGVAKHSNWLHELTVRDGKIVSWLGHNDTAMLAAAYHAAPKAQPSARA